MSIELCGKVLLGYAAFKVFTELWHLVYVYVLGSCPNLQKYGAWSVVTGATDGIGLAFANKLAKKGQNIVLISRNSEKLKNSAEDIESKYGVKTKCIQADFSSTDIYDNIGKQLEDLDIGLLVNNVGISYDYPEVFMSISGLSDFIKTTTALNMTSVMRMTELVMPGMLKKRKGIILNVSSAAALQPTPLLAIYSASKLFVDCFSQALGFEYRNRGLILQTVMPFYVTTKLSKIRKPSWFVPTPDNYASAMLNTIGRSRRTFGCLSHAVQGMFMQLVPEYILMWFAARMNHSVRARALKKRAKSS